MKNFKVIDYRVINRYGNDVTNTFFGKYGNKNTRRIARIIKNAMNVIDKYSSPHRIAEVRVTK